LTAIIILQQLYALFALISYKAMIEAVRNASNTFTNSSVLLSRNQVIKSFRGASTVIALTPIAFEQHFSTSFQAWLGFSRSYVDAKIWAGLEWATSVQLLEYGELF